MDVTKINSRSLVDFIDSAEKLYAKPIGGFKDKYEVEKYLPLIINKVGFYGEKKGDEIYWLPKNKLEFNTSEDVVIVIEGEVNLVKTPINNGSGSLSYEGNGALKVNDTVIYGGAGGSSSQSKEIAFNQEITFDGETKSQVTQSGVLNFTVAASQPNAIYGSGVHYHTFTVKGDSSSIITTNIPIANGQTFDNTKENTLVVSYDPDKASNKAIGYIGKVDLVVAHTQPLYVSSEIGNVDDQTLTLTVNQASNYDITGLSLTTDSVTPLNIVANTAGDGTATGNYSLDRVVLDSETITITAAVVNGVTGVNGGLVMVDFTNQSVTNNVIGFLPSDLSSNVLFDNVDRSFNGISDTHDYGTTYTSPLDSGVFDLWVDVSTDDGQPDDIQLIFSAEKVSETKVAMQLRINGALKIFLSDGTNAMTYETGVIFSNGPQNKVIRLKMDSGVLSVIIDNVLVSRTESTTGSYITRTTNLHLGYRAIVAPTNYFSGNIKNMSIFNSVLTGADESNMNNYYGL